MILADKILALRKKSGWSQEELAEKLHVSRQSISKWESAVSIPDINKILEIAKIFGVSTDFLLKDEVEEPEYTGTDEAPDDSVKMSLEEASEFISEKKKSAKLFGLGVFLCVLSPVLLLVLSAMSGAAGGSVSERAAGGIGVTVLLLTVAVAVMIFIMAGMRYGKYKSLENSYIELDYGVSGVVKEKKRAFEPKFTAAIAIGVFLCIMSPAPLIIAVSLDAAERTVVLFTALLLAIVAAATYLFVYAGTIKSGFDQLLMEDDFAWTNREKNKKADKISGIYWPIITAVYLAWSFITGDWNITWAIWPVAALIFAAVSHAFGKED